MGKAFSLWTSMVDGAETVTLAAISDYQNVIHLFWVDRVILFVSTCRSIYHYRDNYVYDNGKGVYYDKK